MLHASVGRGGGRPMQWGFAESCPSDQPHCRGAISSACHLLLISIREEGALRVARQARATSFGGWGGHARHSNRPGRASRCSGVALAPARLWGHIGFVLRVIVDYLLHHWPPLWNHTCSLPFAPTLLRDRFLLGGSRVEDQGVLTGPGICVARRRGSKEELSWEGRSPRVGNCADRRRHR